MTIYDLLYQKHHTCRVSCSISACVEQVLYNKLMSTAWTQDFDQSCFLDVWLMFQKL